MPFVVNLLRTVEYKFKNGRTVRFEPCVVEELSEEEWKELEKERMELLKHPQTAITLSSEEERWRDPTLTQVDIGWLFRADEPLEGKRHYSTHLEKVDGAALLALRDSWRDWSTLYTKNLGLTLKLWTFELIQEEINRRIEKEVLLGEKGGEFTKLKRCADICLELRLQKQRTVERKTKYEIAKKMGMKVGHFRNFKSGKSKEYHAVSKMLSQIGYKKKTLSY